MVLTTNQINKKKQQTGTKAMKYMERENGGNNKTEGKIHRIRSEKKSIGNHPGPNIILVPYPKGTWRRNVN